MHARYINLRGRRFSFVGGSLARRKVRLTLDATGPCRWLRVGLFPGTGRFRNNTTITSLASVLWVRAPESRTAAVQMFRAGEAPAVAGATSSRRGRAVGWGLLSTARINRALIPPIRASERSRLVAVASRDAERSRQYARAWDIGQSYASYEALLEDPAVDVVYISLPNHLHVEWTVRALEAGKHVLCEKPIALDPAGVDAISEAVQRTGRWAAEAFMYRHHARTLRVKELIASGRIGALRHMEGAFSFLLDNPSNIRMDPEMGGGSLWDVGCYPVSFARYVAGNEPIAAFGRSRPGPSGVDEVFAGALTFEDDVTLHFVSGFRLPPRMEMRFVGTEGIIDLPDAFKPGASSEIVITSGARVERLHVAGRPLYVDEVEDMNEAALGRGTPTVRLADSRANVAALVALHRSAQTGEVVVIGD